MNKLQVICALFALFFAVALVVQIFLQTISSTETVTLGILFITTIIFMILDPSKVSEFAINIAKGEVSYRNASSAEIETSLAIVSRQEDSTQEDLGDFLQASLSALDTALSKAPMDRTDADYLVMATNSWRENDYDHAFRYAYSGLEKPVSDPRITSALYSRLSGIELHLRQNERAEAHCRLAIQINPNNAIAHNNLGIAIDEIEHPNEAIKHLRRAIRIDPSLASAHYNLGACFHQNGRNVEAEEELRTAIELNSEYHAPHVLLGVLLSKNEERLEEARTEILEALRIEPDSSWARHELALVDSKIESKEESEQDNTASS